MVHRSQPVESLTFDLMKRSRFNSNRLRVMQVKQYDYVFAKGSYRTDCDGLLIVIVVLVVVDVSTVAILFML